VGPKKTVYEYTDYREFLKDAFKYLKEENKSFSYRFFSRVAGFKSPSVLKQVMDGQMKLAPSSIEKFAKAFKLNKEESAFFRHLVLFNQARTIDERQTQLKAMLSSRSYKKLHPLSQLQFNYYQHWYHVSIRELVGLDGFQEDPNWIATHISPQITPQEAKKGLENLVELGLIRRNPDGKLEQADANVTTGDEVVSKALANYHREMIKKGAESIEHFPGTIRDISAVTIAVNAESIKTIKEKVQKFRKEILEYASQNANPNVIYQVNFQIFPVTEAVDTEGEE
jgi:uncharacterized protein (TIGR02147 family)